MARYDWGSARGYRGGYAPRGYASDFGRWGDEWGSSPSAGFRGRGAGLHRDWGTPFGAGGYPDRYDRGPHYGGYDAPYAGYDAPYAGRTFVPEELYRRHPRFDRPQRHVSGRWPEGEHGLDRGAPMDDRYVEQSVRESLYGDTWIDPDRIEVEVDDGVVTLRGEVDDYMEARYAWDDAWESPGVRGVLNQLTVRTDQRPHDER